MLLQGLVIRSEAISAAQQISPPADGALTMLDASCFYWWQIRHALRLLLLWDINIAILVEDLPL